jgi:hypothetical protein
MVNQSINGTRYKWGSPSRYKTLLTQHAGGPARNIQVMAMARQLVPRQVAICYHLKGGKWLRDGTEFRGQGGLANDEGRLYYNIIGHNFMPILYLRIVSPK